jgi:hypothetical protein
MQDYQDVQMVLIEAQPEIANKFYHYCQKVALAKVPLTLVKTTIQANLLQIHLLLPLLLHQL